MERQNVTLSVPKQVLTEVKHLAVERGTSISALLTEYLERLLRDEEAYQGAMKRMRTRLDAPGDLGTGGRPASSRERLHER
jgi:hypothetical protein